MAHRLGVDGERADADGGRAGDQRQAAGGGDADAEPGERAGADSDGDAIEIGEGEAGLVHRRGDHAHQALGMAAADDLARQHLTGAADHADGAGFQSGVDGKQAHASGISRQTSTSRGEARSGVRAASTAERVPGRDLDPGSAPQRLTLQCVRGTVASAQASTCSMPSTSGTKWRSRFSMPCLSVAVEDGQPAQAPRMLR